MNGALTRALTLSAYKLMKKLSTEVAKKACDMYIVVMRFVYISHKCILGKVNQIFYKCRKFRLYKCLCLILVLVICRYSVSQGFEDAQNSPKLSTAFPRKSGNYVKLTKLTFSSDKALINNSVDFERLADAIKRAENSKRHPYGIMKAYCGPKTEAQCRKGCLQTIKKRYRMWLELPKDAKHSQTYLEYLASSYAPLDAKNDPSGLNKHWIGNVRRIYEQLG